MSLTNVPHVTYISSGDPAVSEVVMHLRNLLGPDVIFLPIPLGKKGPVFSGWQNTTIEAMADPDYVESLNHGGNIGVKLGRGLCTIDIDNDARAEEFLRLNPRLENTLRSKRKRGFNAWVKIRGEYPSSCRIPGFGEWRADNCQTVIYGEAQCHDEPEPIPYRIIHEAPPVEIKFADIVWPQVALPWKQSAPERSASVGLVAQYGEPYTRSDDGRIRLNQVYYVAKFAREHLVLHEPAEREFYVYNAANGAWEIASFDAIKALFSEDFQRFAHELGDPGLLPLRTNALLEAFAALLRGHVERTEAFKPTGRVIHVANGMLEISPKGGELHDHSPNYHSRNVCPIAWEPNAECPRFKAELLGSALERDDVSLVQRWCGSLLLGRNVAQRIMIFTGTPGGGKSTLLEIIEGIIGARNVCQLRTKHLDERFELGRFIRKTMLSGKDVPGDFLQSEGAFVLKALVGHDLLSAERKNSNGEFQLRGEFGVAISCNARLRVKLDGDVEAWRRRLLIVRYDKPKPAERVLDFAKKLLAEEAPGILQWMVVGAVAHLQEQETVGDFRLIESQERRVDQLLAESDSVRHFLWGNVVRQEDSDLASEEIVSAYLDFCDEMGWLAYTQKGVERALADLMLEMFRSGVNAHIQRNGRRVRGYPHVALKTNMSYE